VIVGESGRLQEGSGKGTDSWAEKIRTQPGSTSFLSQRTGVDAVAVHVYFGVPQSTRRFRSAKLAVKKKKARRNKGQKDLLKSG